MSSALFWAVLLACDGTSGEQGLPANAVAVELEAPTYAEHIRPLFEQHCVSCHAHGAVMHAGVELDTYASARSVRVRNACTAISAELISEFGEHLIPQAGLAEQEACAPWEPLSMPPGATMRLSPDQQRMLAVWVANGAPEF